LSPAAPAPGHGRYPYAPPPWSLGTRQLSARPRPLVMGIVNLTPDSFYPASRQLDPSLAVAAALAMEKAGADLLDLGAESSRPGAAGVTATEEQLRLLPVLRELRRHSEIPVTVDTTRSETAQLSLEAGADGINDITAGTGDPELLAVAAANDCSLILMHMQGSPRTMQDDPQYADVVTEIGDYLAQRVTAAEAAGVTPARIMVDPGIGFGKTLAHNLTLLARLDRIGRGRPVLVGASRKSFIGDLTGAAVADRLGGSLAALAAAYLAGVRVVRVHDVAESVQFLDTLAAIAAADPSHS